MDSANSARAQASLRNQSENPESKGIIKKEGSGEMLEYKFSAEEWYGQYQLEEKVKGFLHLFHFPHSSLIVFLSHGGLRSPQSL